MAGKNKTYELMLKIGGKVDGSLKTACSTADKNLAALGKTAKTAGKIAAGAMVAAATAVATLGTAAVKSAAEYEAQLANVSTLLTGTEAEVAARTAEIGDQVLEISNRTGVATADLTDGMYQVVSAFGDSADAAAILETAAKSAAALARRWAFSGAGDASQSPSAACSAGPYTRRTKAAAWAEERLFSRWERLHRSQPMP